MPLSDVSVSPDDEQPQPEYNEAPPKRPHVAASFYNTFRIDNDTLTVEDGTVTVVRHPSKSLCGTSCSIDPAGAIHHHGNTSWFKLDLSLFSFRGEKPVKLTRGELTALLQHDFMNRPPTDEEQHDYENAVDKLLDGCHNPALESTLSRIPPSKYSTQNSEEANGGCKSGLSQHYVAMVSPNPERPDDDSQLVRDTLVSVRGRTYRVDARPPLQTNPGKTMVMTFDDYPAVLPNNWQTQYRDMPTSYTQKRPSDPASSDMVPSNMVEHERNNRFLQALWRMCCSEEDTLH